MALRNTNTWSAKDGLGDNRAGIACPNFTTPLIVADLNSLANEYPERNSRGDRVREPACGEFSLTGDPSFEFSWDQLSGHALLLKDKKPENSHQWAMVKPSLRNGLNLVYEAAGGIDLKSAYRSPDFNHDGSAVGCRSFGAQVKGWIRCHSCPEVLAALVLFSGQEPRSLCFWQLCGCLV